MYTYIYIYIYTLPAGLGLRPLDTSRRRLLHRPISYNTTTTTISNNDNKQ